MNNPHIPAGNYSTVDLELCLGALHNRTKALLDSLEAGTEFFFGPVGPRPVKDTSFVSTESIGIERCFGYIRGLEEELSRLMVFEEHLRNRIGAEGHATLPTSASISAGVGTVKIDPARIR